MTDNKKGKEEKDQMIPHDILLYSKISLVNCHQKGFLEKQTGLGTRITARYNENV